LRKKERKENGEKREEVEVEVRGRGSRSKSTGEKTLTTTSFRGRSMEGHRFVTLPAPADASARIIPCPIPWVDPVTRATRPARDIEAEGEWQRERERGRERERKQRESRRNREREGERGREREREREKGKNFQSERKNDVRASSRPLKLTQHLEKPSTEPPCCFVLRYVLCLLYHDDSLPFGRRDHRGDPALWHQVRRESWGLEAQGDREEH